MSIGVDQRVFHRLGTKVPVSLRIHQQGLAVLPLEGQTENLSGGGLLLQAPELDPEVVQTLLVGNARIELELLLPGRSEPIASEAALVWMEGRQERDAQCRYGLRFLGMQAADQSLISDWILAQA